jgi:hypothetical protein
MRSPLLKAGLFAISSVMALAAQEQSAPQDQPIHTLHVYTDLVQVPTLVLAGNRERLKTPIPEQNFSISIDYGRWFRVTHVRQEGNDPISLTILLDASGGAAALMPKMSDAIAALAPSLLTPRDHVSIYAMDCVLTRSFDDLAVFDAATLKIGVDAALGPWMTRHQDQHPAKCKPSAHLWDTMGYIANRLDKLPGRRVMLVVTDGYDRGSIRLWNEIRVFTQVTGVAVFGLTNTAIAPGWRPNDANAFPTICELSGGIVMTTSPDSVGKTLEQSITMLRERYIVEFPRPSNSTKGEHDMRVKIAKGGDDFIRPSGISVPIQDPALLADPTTVRSDPSHTPEEGKRRILLNPK